MSKTHDFDALDVMRVLDPRRADPSTGEVDAALRRVLARVPTVETSPGRAWPPVTTRRRLAFGGTAAATAAAAAFVAVNVLPASPTPGAVGDAWAKRVIAHAAAAVSGNGSGILHVVETVTVAGGGSDGPPSQTFAVQTWDSQTAPHEFWETVQQGPGVNMTTISGDATEEYNSVSSTVTEMQGSQPTQFAQQVFDDPEYQAASALAHTSSPTPAAFSDLIAQALKASGVSVNQDANVGGEPAISIAGSITNEDGNDVSYTLYVQPQTYTPLELVTTSGSGTGQSTITTKFSTYETLPAGSVSMPNLVQLYPSAQVENVPASRSTN
jgi:hypothetical protein